MKADTTAARQRGGWLLQERSAYAEGTESPGFRQTAADVATASAASFAAASPRDHQVRHWPEPAAHRSVGVLVRAARRDVEAALDANGWRWNVGLSRWLDVLITLEEGVEQ